MVGLKVVLEGSCGIDWNNCYYSNNSSNASSHQVVSKASIKTTSPTSPKPPSFSRRSNPYYSNSTNSNFLDNCFLCRKKLLPCHDIYMYKGDRAFCSEECRCRQMYMDEEEAATVKAKAKRGNNCSFSANNKPERQLASSSSPSSSRSNRNKSATKKSNDFVY